MIAKDSNVKRILVVEDEPSIGQICQIVLTGEGFDVDVAVNGRIAQDMVGKRQYDVLLVDIRMPSMNGIEFYRWLQQEHSDMQERVAFTSGDMGRDAQNFLMASERPFLPKPFVPDELTSLILGISTRGRSAR